jgi:hypothetical protein
MIGGNSPVGRALVGEGISVRIFATLVAISESETDVGVVVNGKVQAVRIPTIMNIVEKRNNFFGRIFFSSKYIQNRKTLFKFLN